MRTITGAVILLVGIGGLGYWAMTNQAQLLENKIAEAAGAVDVTPVHGIDVSVSGRDVVLTGTVDGPKEADALYAAYSQVPGRREVRTDWTVLPEIVPFVLAVRWQDQAMVAEGHLPTEEVRTELAPLLGQTEALPLGAGAPDAWGAAAALGLEAARRLEEGEMRLEDRKLTLTGIGRSPAEAAQIEALLAQLPEGYESELSIEYLDDGTPPEYSITYDASTGLRIDGKLPAGLTPEQVAEALDFVAYTGDVRTGLLGDAEGHVEIIGPIAEWLPDLERLTIERTQDDVSVVGAVRTGVDTELVASALSEAVGTPVNLTVSTAHLPDGSLRTNAATGETEVARAGYWLPNIQFAPDVQTCTNAMTATLFHSPINFLTGSARLDAKASRVINEMASVAALCVETGQLRAEIGGHTDSVGDAAGNRALSEARANAVRAALIARGVAPEALTAQGYGESDPIDTNDTEEGRAANRRTTVVWSPSDDGVN